MKKVFVIKRIYVYITLQKKPKPKPITTTPKVNGSVKRKISTPSDNSFKDQTPNKNLKLNASISRAQSALSKFSSPVSACLQPLW